MDRARRAGFTALIVVVVVATAGGFRRPQGPGRLGHLAAVDTRGFRGTDGRSIGLRRIRRGRQPGDRATGPGRARGGLCNGLGIHGDAQGDLDGVNDPRAGQAHPDRQRRRGLCRLGRCDISSGFAATGGAIAFAWSAARRSMRSAGETRAVRSSREPRPQRHPPAPASSVRPADWPGMRPTRTTTSAIGSSRARRRRRV